MTLPSFFKDRLAVPVIAAPMFLISQPNLVLAQCRAGVVGSFPALNARPSGVLELWLQQLTSELSQHDAPFAVNLIVHKSNDRLEEDVRLCVKYKVPIIITSLGARTDVNVAIHGYGGFVFHDVINNVFARKAIEKGADGLVAVAAGAGGHAGILSPFALVQEIRQWFDGPLALSGAIGSGGAIAAARALGADLAYIGSVFIATNEASASPAYKQMIVDSTADDIIYSNLFTGIYGNYLKPSIVAAGLNPTALPTSDPSASDFGKSRDGTKAWRDIWGCGQGISAVHEVVSAATLIARLGTEYSAAIVRLVK